MNYRARFFAFFLVLFTVLVVAGGLAGGCGDTVTTFDTCDAAILGRTDEFGNPDPCCQYSPCCPSPVLDHYSTRDFPDVNGNPYKDWDPCCKTEPCPDHNPWLPQSVPSDMSDAGDADAAAQSSLCPGQCVPTAPEGWFAPVLLWQGPPEEEPPCPAQARYDGYHGYADLDAPTPNCGACECNFPTGECGLPSELWAVSNSCVTPGGTLTSFNAPPSWDGSCTAEDAIPGGAQCNGSPCVKSLTSAPLVLTETGCTPFSKVPGALPLLGAAWKTSAVACQVSEYPPCSPTQVCAPSADAGFATCIFTWGDDHPCPDRYPDRHVFYDDYNDTRGCVECACGPPIGSECKATLSVYQDNACKGPPSFPGLDIFAEAESYCVDLGPGIALGSKSITKPIYTHGTCQPSAAKPTGELSLLGAATFCCLQS
jgi:hypothetical protein